MKISWKSPKKGIKGKLVGGWTTQVKNMLKSNWIISPKFRGENKEKLKQPPRKRSFPNLNVSGILGGFPWLGGFPDRRKLVAMKFAQKNLYTLPIKN